MAADLVLDVAERPGSRGRIFDFRLEVARPWLADLELPTYGAIRFRADPAVQLQQHLKRIGEARLHTEPQRAAFAEILRAEGAHLSRKLLPTDVRRCLASLRGRARSLHVISDAPWIPWELLRIENEPTASRIDGPFLCAAFALTHGLRGVELPAHLPLARIAVVIPRNQRLRREQQLANLEGEWEDMGSLRKPRRRRMERIEAHRGPVLAALGAGVYEGWHFSTHGSFKDQVPDLSGIELEDEELLYPSDLAGKPLGKRRPLVFLNACSSGQVGFSLTSTGGWAAQFLAAGAGAFLGALWPVYDHRARAFARTFYASFLAGETIGEAARAARESIQAEDDPTWLAYAVFALPEAICARAPRVVTAVATPRPASEPDPLELPRFSWRRETSSPGALLRAEYDVVRFHGREREMKELEDWCLEGPSVRVRLYTGAGGMGKTRLAREAARRLQAKGWQAGFLSPSSPLAPHETWEVLARRGQRIFVVVDYAETRRELLIPILRAASRVEKGPVRIVLLARAALDWWEQLRHEREGVGNLLSGPATSKHPLGPLALSVPQRMESFGYALADFARALDRSPPATQLAEPEQKHFERALILHMSGLAAIEGVPVKGEAGILDFVLGRERQHWRERARLLGIQETLVPGIGRAMAAITLAGGVEGERQAVGVLAALEFFAGQTRDVLVAIARLLRQSYPGTDLWIEPILPDLLAEHLVQREMEQDSEELLTVVCGPKGMQPGAG